MKARRKKFNLLFIVLLTLFLTILLSGCGKSATEMFETAQKNMYKAKDFTVKDGKFKAYMEVQGQKVEVNAPFSMQFKRSKSDDPRDFQIAMNMTINMMMQKGYLSVYIKDKTVYTESEGKKQKKALEIGKEDFKKMTDASDDIKLGDYSKKESKDGDKVTLTIDGKKYLNDVMKKLNDANLETKAKSDFKNNDFMKEMEDIGINDITVEATIENDNFTALKYSIPMEIDGEIFGAQGIKMKIKAVCDFPKIRINKGDKIAFPDLSSFK